MRTCGTLSSARAASTRLMSASYSTASTGAPWPRIMFASVWIRTWLPRHPSLARPPACSRAIAARQPAPGAARASDGSSAPGRGSRPITPRPRGCVQSRGLPRVALHLRPRHRAHVVERNVRRALHLEPAEGRVDDNKAFLFDGVEAACSGPQRGQRAEPVEATRRRPSVRRGDRLAVELCQRIQGARADAGEAGCLVANDDRVVGQRQLKHIACSLVLGQPVASRLPRLPEGVRKSWASGGQLAVRGRQGRRAHVPPTTVPVEGEQRAVSLFVNRGRRPVEQVDGRRCFGFVGVEEFGKRIADDAPVLRVEDEASTLLHHCVRKI
eukprot:5017128-Prymnesium_polylepis.2